jgi:hypothetical protein
MMRLALLAPLPVALAAAVVLTHEAAWAEKSWYLLVPPLSKYDEASKYLEGYKVLTSEPLSKWNHAASYDTAVECETDKSTRTLVEGNRYEATTQEHRRLISANAAENQLKLQRLIVERANAQLSALGASRCIASDDPRLR